MNSTEVKEVKLLGHKNVETTMIYTHVTGQNKIGVTSPVDMLLCAISLYSIHTLKINCVI